MTSTVLLVLLYDSDSSTLHSYEHFKSPFSMYLALFRGSPDDRFESLLFFTLNMRDEGIGVFRFLEAYSVEFICIFTFGLLPISILVDSKPNQMSFTYNI